MLNSMCRTIDLKADFFAVISCSSFAALDEYITAGLWYCESLCS